MKLVHIKRLTKLTLFSVIVAGMTLGAVVPVGARPTDGASWTECKDRQTVKTKPVVGKNGKTYGTLYIYKCSNGVFARVKSTAKREILLNISRSSPYKVLHGQERSAFHAMTSMLYFKSGACYSAHGYISSYSATADTKVCL